MFGLFIRIKAEDKVRIKEAAISFWSYFEKEEHQILHKLSLGGQNAIFILDDLEIRLKAVFPKYHKDLMFGISIEDHDFDISHQNSKYLKTLIPIFKENLPNSLKQRWSVSVVA